MAATAIVALVATELAPTPSEAVRIDRAPAYDESARTPAVGIVAHYPMMTDRAPAEQLAAARGCYYQRFTGSKLFEIYGSERRGRREDAIRWLARYVTDRRTPGILAAEGGLGTSSSTTTCIPCRESRYPDSERSSPSSAGSAMCASTDCAQSRRISTARSSVPPAHSASCSASRAPSCASARVFTRAKKYLDYNGTWRWMNQDGTLVLENRGDKQIRARSRGTLSATKSSAGSSSSTRPAGSSPRRWWTRSSTASRSGPSSCPPERRGSGCGRCQGRARSAAPIRGAPIREWRASISRHWRPGRSPTTRRACARADERVCLLRGTFPLFLEDRRA